MECSIEEVALTGHDFRWGVASAHEGSCLPAESGILQKDLELRMWSSTAFVNSF